MMKKALWTSTGILAVMVGLYPVIYFVIDKRFGLLGSKPEALLIDDLYNAAFYGHIIFGGLALLIGWLQFSTKLRRTRISLHRIIGKTYVLSVLLSGLLGLYIALYATGGMIPMLGFISSDIVWLTTTILGIRAVVEKNFYKHQKFMIYSYAVCFSAVTLRIWLPLLEALMGNFLSAYRMVAWLSWIPNIMFAFYWTTKRIHVIPHRGS